MFYSYYYNFYFKIIYLSLHSFHTERPTIRIGILATQCCFVLEALNKKMPHNDTMLPCLRGPQQKETEVFEVVWKKTFFFDKTSIVVNPSTAKVMRSIWGQINISILYIFLFFHTSVLRCVCVCVCVVCIELCFAS